jgi:hypothetical protein
VPAFFSISPSAVSLSRPVARHRVIAVRDDEEVGREGDLARLNSVVALAVGALVVVLDSSGLVTGEPEAPEQPRRKSRMEPHRSPLVLVELARFAEHGGVDRHLAEVMETTGPAQPGHLGRRELEPVRELPDVLGNAFRVVKGV